MRSFRHLRIPLAALVAAFACAQALPATTSSFTNTTANNGNSITAKADWTAPTVSAVVTQRSDGGATNKLKSGATFYVYADITDTGNPSSGLGTMTASVTNIATVSSTTLTAGSWTINGVTYDARSAQLTAKNLSTGSYSYSVSVSDGAGNGPASKSGTATADTTAFNVSSVTTTNVATAGRPLATDKLIFTFNKAPEASSLYDDWDGTSKSVKVQLSDGANYGWSGTNQDVIGVTDANGDVTPLGYVVTGGNYIQSNRVVMFNNSTMVLSGSTVTITLGTPDNSSYLSTDSGSRTMQWTAMAGPTDTFGNTLSTTNVNSTSKVQF